MKFLHNLPSHLVGIYINFVLLISSFFHIHSLIGKFSSAAFLGEPRPQFWWPAEALGRGAHVLPCIVTVQPDQASPPRSHSWIYYLKVESVGSCRFISTFLHA